MKNKFIYWWVLATLVFLCLPATALAADNPLGVAYRGHIQDLGDYPSDGSWVASPAIIGTIGESKRIEGFEIKLTGTIPAGMEMRYNVHVQNKGWLYDEDDSANWPKDGAYAGTRGESLRIEAVKIVLTDSDGKAVPGYSVQYRGHVQNVGDLPQAADQWLANGKQLGTVGSSLRLEALQVQVIKTMSQTEPDSGIVTPNVSTLKTAITVTSAPLDLNSSGIFAISPVTDGVLSNVAFTSDNDGLIASGIVADGKIPFLQDGTVNLTFKTASVTLGGITYDNISLNNAVIAITSLSKINSGNGTVLDYFNAGITGVVAENLSGINQEVSTRLPVMDKTAIQKLVNNYLAGANAFSYDMTKNDWIIETEAFDLNIYDAKDSYGNYLNGQQIITVKSQFGDSNKDVLFANGSATVPVTLDDNGIQKATVYVGGITTPQELEVLVCSKLEYDPSAPNIVTGYDVAYGKDVVVPPYNHGTAVTEIGVNAFFWKGLTSIWLLNGLEKINDGAFASNYLTDAFIPDSVSYLGKAAFRENNLSSLELSKNLTVISEAAFDKNNLQSVELPQKLSLIGANAFSNNNLTSITIGTGVTIEGFTMDGYTMGAYGDSFAILYNHPPNNQAGGTYTYGVNGWSK